MNIEIANRLVQLRKEKGFSQEELAAQLGISRQAVYKWERAESSPDTDNLILLARLYGMSLDQLLSTDAPDEELRETSAGTQPGAAGERQDAAQENPAAGTEAAQEEASGMDGGSSKSWTWTADSAKDGGEDDEDDDETLRPSMLTGAVTLLSVLAFLLLGFCFNLWHPGWIVFLLIPLYACITSGSAEAAASMLSTILFLLLGTIWGLWHPGWLVFLIIPAAATIRRPFRILVKRWRRRRR